MFFGFNMGQTKQKLLRMRDFLGSVLWEFSAYIWNFFFSENRYKEQNIVYFAN